jgi:hypothetical protein
MIWIFILERVGYHGWRFCWMVCFAYMAFEGLRYNVFETDEMEELCSNILCV